MTAGRSVSVSISEDELFGRPPMYSTPVRKIFLSFRFNDERSVALKDGLISAFDRRRVELLHGADIPPGAAWADSVKRLIDTSRLYLGDLTGVSHEILFEMGLAARKSSIWLLDERRSARELPGWLQVAQLREYSSTSAPALAQEIRAMLERKLTPKPIIQGRPEPNWVCLVRSREPHEWATWLEKRRAILCEQNDMQFEVVKPDEITSRDKLNSVAKSMLYVFALDGGEVDGLAHYLLGDAVAHQRAGSGSGAGESLERRAIVVTGDPNNSVDFMALMAKTVSTRVRVIAHDPMEALRAARASADRYRRFLTRDEA